MSELPSLEGYRRRQELALLQEKRARRAISDRFYWLTNCTKTKDEQDTANPYKPFPNKPYFLPILEFMSRPEEATIFMEKSRTMMMSWLVCGWAAHFAFNNPAVQVVFQSQDEDRAVHDVENVKVLWDNTEPDIRDRWPLKKPLEKQPYNRLELANGSNFIGIPGDPNKMRSLHPTVAVLDEAAFILRGNETYNVVKATRAPKVICLSSAEKGWFHDFVGKAMAVDWI